MSTYTANIPQANDDPSQSQSLILGNFQTLDTSNSVNHVAFNLANQGKHKFLQMPEQGSAPATAVNEGGLYTKVSNGTTELFWRKESNGMEIQLTDGVPTGNTTFLPGGLMLQWGSGLGQPGGADITYPVAFSTIYQVVATVLNTSSASVAVADIQPTKFTAYTSANDLNVIYFAIGVA